MTSLYEMFCKSFLLDKIKNLCIDKYISTILLKIAKLDVK